jgi:hypothetical protein
MARRGYHLVSFAQYVIGATFAFFVFAIAATALAATGSAINSRQAQSIGNVYADVLMRIEDGARALRADYCARGNIESGHMCGDPDLLLGAEHAPLQQT